MKEHEMYSLIYDVFNNPVSISDYTEFNDIVGAYFRLFARHSPGDTVKNHEKPRQANRCPAPNVKGAPHEYNSDV